MADFETMKVDAPKIESISNDFLIDFISNSISLDTCDISKELVSKILDNEPVDCSETVKSLVKDYLEGFLFVVKIAANKEEFTENTLKDLHQIVVKDKALGGLYRNVDISIKGSNHTPPSYIKVYDRMKKYFVTINDENNDLWYNIAFSHAQLMKVHPFIDGNGRCARIVLNYQLIKNGFNPVVIRFEDKDKYFDLLEEFKVNKNNEPLIEYIKELSK